MWMLPHDAQRDDEVADVWRVGDLATDLRLGWRDRAGREVVFVTLSSMLWSIRSHRRGHAGCWQLHTRLAGLIPRPKRWRS